MKSKVEKRSAICSTVDEFERQYVKPKPGKVLVVGSHIYATRTDRRARYPNAVGVDMVAGDGVDHVVNLEDKVPFYLGPFSHIDCISVLEHSRRPWLLAQNIEYLLHKGNTLYLQVPFVWRIHSYPDDYWRMSVAGVRALFPSIEWKALQYVPGEIGLERVSSMWHGKELYFLRTEVCGFGEKK